MSERSAGESDLDSSEIEIVVVPGNAREQARAGVRGWAGRAGRATRRGTRKVGPWAALATVCAATLAPVAGQALGLAGYELLVGQLVGGIGGNLMAELLSDAAGRVQGVPSEDEWRSMIATLLAERLAAPEEESGALREEVRRLLTNVDAISVAVEASALTASGVGERLVAALGDLGEDFTELQDQTLASLNRLQDELSWRSAAERQQNDRTQSSLTGLTVQMADLIARLQRSQTDRGSARSWVTRRDECPYPGLASFEATQADLFFGRTTLVGAVLTKLAQLAQVPSVPLVLVGVSGVGKSSLLNAGVIPAVQGGGLPGAAAWRTVLLTPTSRPLAVLLGAVAEAELDPLSMLEALRRQPQDFGVIAAHAAGPNGRLLIVVDQFEELFTGGASEPDRQAFVTALLNADPAVVVIAVRADFYPRCMELPPLARVISDRQVVVGPMTGDDLREVVLQPADRAGLEVQPALLQILMADLKVTAGGYEPGSLPLLAQALQATWERRDGDVLTVAGYRAAGSISGAIEKKADDVFIGLDPEGREQLRQMLLRGVAVTGGETSRKPIPRDGLPVEPLARMVAARLMTAGEDTVQITHEALLSAWPKLRHWVEESRRDLEARQLLSEAANYWDENQKDVDSLYRGSRLDATREWLSTRQDLTITERDFLSASDAASRREIDEERRRSMRLRGLVGVLSVALVVILGAAVVARNTATRKHAHDLVASSQREAAESTTVAPTDSRQAMLLSTLAWSTSHTQEARGALLSAQMLNYAGTLNDPGTKTAIAMSRDGRLIATGDEGGGVALWDARSHRLLAKLAGTGPQQITSLNFSPDDSMLAATSWAPGTDGLKVWSIPSGRRLHLPAAGGVGDAVWASNNVLISLGYEGTPSHQTSVLLMQDLKADRIVRQWADGFLPEHLAMSPDGKRVAVGYYNGAVRLIRLRDDRLVRVLPPPSGLSGPSTAAVAFASDGMLAVAQAMTGQVTLWDGLTGAHLKDLPLDQDHTNTLNLAFSRDGSLLYVLGASSNLLTWDFTTSQWLTQVIGRSDVTGRGVLTSIAISGDGHTVAMTGDRPTLLAQSGVHWRHFQETGVFTGLAVSEDGRRLAAGGLGKRGTVWVTDLATNSYRAAIPDAGSVREVAFSRDGALAAINDEGRVWLKPASGPTRSINLGVQLSLGLGFSPDSSLLAATTPPKVTRPFTVPGLRIWDAHTLRPIAIAPTTVVPGDLTFSPDGSRVAVVGSQSSGSRRSSVLLWDVARLRRGDTRPERTIDIGLGAVGRVVFSPDSRMLAVAAGDDRVHLLDPTSGRLIRTLAHTTDTIRSVRFSPDGMTLATITTDDDSIQLWKVADGSSLATLTGSGSTINNIEFNPKSPTLYSTGADGTVGTWNLNPSVALGNICAALSGDLEAGDWRGLGVDPKKSPCS